MKVYSVTEFREEINELLGQVTVAIQGEVCDFHIAQNRFVWFSLKDDHTVVPCFAMTFQLQVPLENGMEIRAVGSPTIFKKGQFVFKPRQIELVGQGSLQKAFELLKSKLSKEVLFDQDRKRTLPRFPRRIGLITSEDAAAYTDVLRILKNRWSGLEIIHANVNVQGVQAVPSIVEALQNMNRFEPDLDAVILTRGGGSLEDLQAFNTEEVVRAIFASRIPVVCAVGHERDVTLADLVADVRASTPSNAAEMIVPDKRDVADAISALVRQSEHLFRRVIQRDSDWVAGAVQILDQRARANNNAFERLEQRLQFALQKHESAVTLSRTRLDHLMQILHSVNPLHVLRRGYTMTLDRHGVIVRSAKRIRPGEELVTRFADGDIHSTTSR
jgi:exodeoxyribonuclease VII large subunit